LRSGKSVSMTAAEIRCRWCNALLIELGGAPWRYFCQFCGGRESSTGVVNGPLPDRVAKRVGGGAGPRYLRLAAS
jgi:hypothetical protein